MSTPHEGWVRDVFAHEVANDEAVAASKKKSVTVSSYFDVLGQLDVVRTDLIYFGGKYGATRFDGVFDLRRICKAYMECPESRARINEVAGLE